MKEILLLILLMSLSFINSNECAHCINIENKDFCYLENFAR